MRSDPSGLVVVLVRPLARSIRAGRIWVNRVFVPGRSAWMPAIGLTVATTVAARKRSSDNV